MGIKIVVDQNEPILAEVRRFTVRCNRAGVRTRAYVRLADRNRCKDHYDKPGVKRRRQKHIARKRQRIEEAKRGRVDWNSA